MNRIDGNAAMFDAGMSKPSERSKVAPYITGGNAKRIFDVLVVSVTMPALLLVFAIVIVSLKLADPGPVIFRQVRVGYNGRRFQCLKFRTMAVNSDEALKRLLESDPEVRREWDRTQKLTNDPRITAVGKFLRQSSLDELPQLINVIRGDMSLVGPRPIVPPEVTRYGDRLGLYLQARPGITGIWQTGGRSDCGYDQRIEMDANYVRHWRFLTDLSILLRTPGAVLARKGSY